MELNLYPHQWDTRHFDTVCTQIPDIVGLGVVQIDHIHGTHHIPKVWRMQLHARLVAYIVKCLVQRQCIQRIRIDRQSPYLNNVLSNVVRQHDWIPLYRAVRAALNFSASFVPIEMVRLCCEYAWESSVQLLNESYSVRNTPHNLQELTVLPVVPYLWMWMSSKTMKAEAQTPAQPTTPKIRWQDEWNNSSSTIHVYQSADWYVPMSMDTILAHYNRLRVPTFTDSPPWCIQSTALGTHWHEDLFDIPPHILIRQRASRQETDQCPHRTNCSQWSYNDCYLDCRATVQDNNKMPHAIVYEVSTFINRNPQKRCLLLTLSVTLPSVETF